MEGVPSIAHGGLIADSLSLKLPEDNQPTLALDCCRRKAGPHLPAVDIHYIQVGFAPFAAELLIERQRTRRRGPLSGQPDSCSFSGLLNQATNLSHRQRDPQQFLQTGLDLPIAGMRFDQQREYLSCQVT